MASPSSSEDGAHRPGPSDRRRIAWTAGILAATAIGFYIAFILVTAAKP